MSVQDQGRIRTAAIQCLLPGERAWHMAKERPDRRRHALSVMAKLPLTVTIYRSRITPQDRGEEQARRRCFGALVQDMSGLGPCPLLIESRDDHLDHRDRRTLQALLTDHQLEVSYAHARHETEALLWIADVYAWAGGASSDWRRRLHPSTRVVPV